MIEAISPGYNLNYLPAFPQIKKEESSKVKEEFLAIFYKEILKQVFKSPDLRLGDNEQKSMDLVGSFGSDLMIDQLARELARKGSFDAKWLNFYRGGK
ncbi:MAG: hypothetical protein ACPL4K_05815 [Candidatus Margulisiibacteriota bacterium]